MSRPARWAGQGMNLTCIIIHVSICIGGCNKQEKGPSFAGAPVFVWVSRATPILAGSCGNASRSALVVHPFT